MEAMKKRKFLPTQTKMYLKRKGKRKLKKKQNCKFDKKKENPLVLGNLPKTLR